MAIRISRSRSAKISLAVLSAATLCLSNMIHQQAQGAVFLQWTFEGISTSTTASSVGPFSADFNPGAISNAAKGFHTAATSVWSAPSGNGSAHSLSANTWSSSPGDYFEFDLDSTGQTGLTLSFDAVGSATGPRDFKVQYSLDPTHIDSSFVDLPSGTYSLTSSPSWSSTAASTSAAEHFSFDLSSLSGVTGIRLVDTGTTAINGSTVGTGGTSRVDNVTFSNDTPTPEPGTVGVLAAGAAFLLGRRRAKK